MSFAKINPIEKNIRPGFVGDFLNREHLLPGGIKLDATTFPGVDAIAATTTGAAQGATAVPVAALAGAIPSGTVLDFGGAKFARLTANAAAGATSLTVAALPTALVNGDVARYLASGLKKRVAAGTPVFATQAAFEAAGTNGLRWKNAGNGVAVGATDYVMILAFDVQDLDDSTDADALRRGTLIRVNHMYWETLSTSVKDRIRAIYEVTVGTPGQEVPAA